MTTGAQAIENMNLNLRCPKVGHDKQPLSFVYPIPGAREHLFCSNCLALDHPELSQKVLDLKIYLADKYDQHKAVMT